MAYRYRGYILAGSAPTVYSAINCTLFPNPSGEPKRCLLSHPATRVFMRANAWIVLAVAVTKAGKFRWMAARTSRKAASRDRATPQAQPRKHLGSPDDPCAASFPATQRNPDQTLPLRQLEGGTFARLDRNRAPCRHIVGGEILIVCPE